MDVGLPLFQGFINCFFCAKGGSVSFQRLRKFFDIFQLFISIDFVYKKGVKDFSKLEIQTTSLPMQVLKGKEANMEGSKFIVENAHFIDSTINVMNIGGDFFTQI